MLKLLRTKLLDLNIIEKQKNVVDTHRESAVKPLTQAVCKKRHM